MIQEFDKESTKMSTTSSHKKFHRLLNEFSSAMLVSHDASDNLHARPMIVAGVEEDCDVWFVTDKDSGKVDAISAQPDVNVSLQGGGKFLSLSGHAEVVYDPLKVADLWNEMWKVWFPDGPSDPGIALIKVNAVHGEYWDNSGLNGLKYMFEAGKAYLKGETPDFVEGSNEKVKLS